MLTADTRGMGAQTARNSTGASTDAGKKVSPTERGDTTGSAKGAAKSATAASRARRSAAAPSKDAHFHGFVTVQSRGTVALPALLRKRFRLDEPGAQMEITEREDGVLELRPTVAVPATEAWFWTDRWQKGERAVDDHVAAGETTVHESADDFLAHLDALAPE